MPPATELDLTVCWPRRRATRVDVRVTAPAGATVAHLLPVLLEALGTTSLGSTSLGTAAPVVSCAGVALAPEMLLGSPPLVHGATLVLGGTPVPASSVTSPLDLLVVAGPDAGHRVPLAPHGVVVGRASGLGLSLDDERLSRRHAVVTPTDHGVRVTDLSSTNGTRCGGLVLTPGASAEVEGSQHVAIGDSLLRLARAGTTAPTRARGDGRVAVHRSPRTRPPWAPATITAPTPPTPPRRGRIPWLAAALPLPFAGLLAAFFGPQMLAFALMSPLMLVGTVVGDRWSGRREHARALAEHAVEQARRLDELDALRLLEREQRWADSPDPGTVLDIASGPGTRLWERRPGSADVGRVRLGVGDLPSRTGWLTPGGVVEHRPLPGVPVEVDLREVGGLGVAGPLSRVQAVLRQVVGQVATLHSPRDVHCLVVVGRPASAASAASAATDTGARDVESRDADADAPGSGGDDGSSWMRWLPHTTAYGEVSTCLDALRRLVLSREADLERGRTTTHPHVLVVLPDSEGDPDLGELVELLERGRDLGVWSIAGARTAAALPGTSHAVVTLDRGERDGSARLDVDGAEPVTSFTADGVQWWWGERLARGLAPLVDASAEVDTVPTSVDLLQLLPWLDAPRVPDTTALARHWRSGSGRPVARLGRLAGADWVVDLAADGPHLLLGGTTGSGKSELLRTLVASLALECSPADVTFVLIDYKGGAAFGDCAHLPHTVGLVTNLDEGLSRRALTSLRAEITRRERLLAASSAHDFDEHRRLEGGLPRLVIVIDEFRVLADELPDFVDGVVSLAAVGRSLGVHLVLATQRPAGAVTADIQANVNLRIAMRVRDTADSTDVIGAPDAAHLPTDRPGRGFARDGDGRLVEFQAARVRTGAAPTALRVDVLGPCGSPAPVAALADEQPDDARDGLADIAAAARGAATTCGLAAPHRPWLPPLPERLGLEAVGGDGVALVDLPGEQRQEVLAHAGRSSGHWLLAGGPRSGRTTCLRSVVASHVADPGSPVDVYAVDTGGGLSDLAALPQVGAVVSADDVSRARRLLTVLRSRCRSADGAAPRPVLLVVDGWERLESDGDAALGGLREDLLDLLRSGLPALRAVVTGDRTLLTGRVGAVAGETFLLPLADPSEAASAGLSPRDLPSSRTPGRALRLGDRREVQFALRDPMAEAAVRDPALPPPVAVPHLPRDLDLARLADLPAASDPALLPVGLSAETGGVASLDIGPGRRRVLVVGHQRSGRSTTLVTIAAVATDRGRTVAVVEAVGGEVGRALPGALVVDPWDAERLVDARRRHPDLVVLVDDAERVDGTPVEPVLCEIAALVDRDLGLVVVATTPNEVATRFRGIVAEVSRAQHGLLLRPRSPGDGEAFGVRAARGLADLPGRALLVSGGRQHELQVARVAASRAPQDERRTRNAASR